MSQRYCRHCGAELKPDAKFCSACGRETDHAGDSGERPAEAGGHATGQHHGTATGQHHGPDTGTHGAATGTQEPDTTLAALTHVLGLFSWLIGPLIVYLVTDDEYAKENAANATDWQIMFTVYMLISIPLVFVLVGIVLLLVLPVVDLAFCVIAAVKAHEGETWSYPFTPDIL